jgi:hypothetical protein
MSESTLPLEPDRTEREYRCYRLVETLVEVEAPLAVARVLDTTMIRVRSASSGAVARVSVERIDDRYVVTGTTAPSIELPLDSVIPAIAGAVTTIVAREVARAALLTLIEAVVVERDGRALAMIGPGWNEAVAIATHLSVRGWRILTSRFAFLDPATLTISGFAKLLYIETARIPELPRQYRRALEASPWHSTVDGIAFYGVDPLVAEGATAWADHAKLAGALVITADHATEAPTIDLASADDIVAAFPGAGTALSDVTSASLSAGPTLATVNFVEHWFDMMPVPA